MASASTGKKKQSAGKKAPAKKKTAAKKPASSKSSTASAKSRQEMIQSRRQVYSSVLFCIALLLLAVVLIPGPDSQTNLWVLLRAGAFGSFGLPVYILPLILIYIAVSYLRDSENSLLWPRVVLSVSGVGGICMLIHLIGNDSTFLTEADISFQIKNAFEIGKNGFNGGVVGALPGGALAKILGKGGAIATVVILIILLFMLLTGTTPLKIAQFIKKLFGSVASTAKSSRDRSENNSLQPEEEDFSQQIKKYEKKHEVKNGKGYKKPDTEDVLKPPADKAGGKHPSATVSGPQGIDAILDSLDTGGVFSEEESKSKTEKTEKPAKEEENTAPESTEPKEEVNKVYSLPDTDIFPAIKNESHENVREEMNTTSAKLLETLKSFGIEANLVDIVRGPTVTRYDIQIAPGIKISKVVGLAPDISMNLATDRVRIAPIPNKAAIGIEVPNKKKRLVTIRELLESDSFKNLAAKSKLAVVLGKDISGGDICADLAKMPHLLVAGTTGSGKSVCMNSMIISILFNATPDEVKLILIDPKKVEFTVYNGIPHLMVPVVSDARKAAGALSWAVTEMLRRYSVFSDCGARDFQSYNRMAKKDPLMTPMYQICIFIDELSDLMMVAQNEVESSICRLAQMARAAGMHLVVATQRPSVDVITGLIKSNIPSRLALTVSSATDSRTIIDIAGADALLGNGDMLFNPMGISKPKRIQGCYISDEEIANVAEFVKGQEKGDYDEEIIAEIDRQAAVEKKKKGASVPVDTGFDDGSDSETLRAIEVVVEHQVASATLLQRKLKVGYPKASRILDELEEMGIVGPSEGSKPRKLLITQAQFMEMKALGKFNSVPSSDESDPFDDDTDE